MSFLTFVIYGYVVAAVLVLLVYPIVSAIAIGRQSDLTHDYFMDEWFGWTFAPAIAILFFWWIVIPIALLLAIPALVFGLTYKVLPKRLDSTRRV